MGTCRTQRWSSRIPSYQKHFDPTSQLKLHGKWCFDPGTVSSDQINPPAEEIKDPVHQTSASQDSSAQVGHTTLLLGWGWAGWTWRGRSCPRSGSPFAPPTSPSSPGDRGVDDLTIGARSIIGVPLRWASADV